MLDALRQRNVAKVLFDEHHGEAWSIRPEAAARMRPSHPAAASYAAAAAELDGAGLRGRDDHRPAARRSGARRRGRARDRPPERLQVGAHGRRRLAAVLALRDRRRPGVRGRRRRPRRPRRRRRGQVRRQPQRPARAVRRAAREHDRVRLRPGRRRAVVGRRRGRARGRRPRHPAPRPRGRASTAPARCPRTTPAPSCCARAPRPTRPAPPWSPRRRTRRAASWSSPTRTSSATTTWRRRDNRQLWLNLAVLGVAGRVPRRRDAHRLRGGAGPGVAAPQGRDQRPAPPAGAQGRGRPGRARRGRGAGARGDDGRGHRRPRAALPARGGLPRPGGRRPAGLGRGRLRQAGLHGARWTSSAPSCTARTASRTSSSSPCTRPTARRTRASRR